MPASRRDARPPPSRPSGWSAWPGGWASAGSPPPPAPPPRPAPAPPPAPPPAGSHSPAAPARRWARGVAARSTTRREGTRPLSCWPRSRWSAGSPPSGQPTERRPAMPTHQLIRADGLSEPISHYSDAVRAGDTVYVSGQASVARHGKLVGAGDVVAQTRQVLENMKLALAAAGAPLDDGGK